MKSGEDSLRERGQYESCDNQPWSQIIRVYEFFGMIKCNCRDNDCMTLVKPDEARSSADCAPFAGVGICGGYGGYGGYGAKARMILK